jgi:hypothetical protein
MHTTTQVGRGAHVAHMQNEARKLARVLPSKPMSSVFFTWHACVYDWSAAYAIPFTLPFFVVHVEISDFFAMGCGTPFFLFWLLTSHACMRARRQTNHLEFQHCISKSCVLKRWTLHWCFAHHETLTSFSAYPSFILSLRSNYSFLTFFLKFDRSSYWKTIQNMASFAMACVTNKILQN